MHQLIQSTLLQQQQLKQQTKSNNNRNSNIILGEDESFSPFSILNKLVYLFFIVGIIHFLNRDYDNIVTIWFLRSFPREAATLGFFMDEL
jgi:hypothetical protein